MPRKELRPYPRNRQNHGIDTWKRGEAARQEDKQHLLNQEAQIRGSLKVSKWIDVVTDIGFFGGFFGGLGFGVAGFPEAAMASLGVNFASFGIKLERNLWSVNNGRTIDDLDDVQEKLLKVHHVEPDPEYFKRTLQKDRARFRALSEVALMRSRTMR